jgi:rare lipoprotein A
LRVKARIITLSCIILLFCSITLSSCSILSTTYKIIKGTVKTTYNVTKGAVKVAFGSGKVVYKVGGFTFKVVMAPITWPLTRKEIESIDDLPPKEAIRKGRVKNAPYVVHGKRYVPMSVEEARKYRQKGTASWYGYETRRKKGFTPSNPCSDYKS